MRVCARVPTAMATATTSVSARMGAGKLRDRVIGLAGASKDPENFGADELVCAGDSLDYKQETTMADNSTVTRAQLIDKLNEDLSREYQAIIAYVVYSQ